MISTALFALQWVYRQHVERLQQLKVLFGSLALWLQVALVPLLLIMPLPMLRLLQPGYNAATELHGLVLALLAWQSVGRLGPLTSSQQMAWQLLWPRRSHAWILQLIPAFLSQWPFWCWSLFTWGLALWCANGPLAFDFFGVWFSVLCTLALLSWRYCPFVLTMVSLPWLCAQQPHWLVLVLLLEWGAWQLLCWLYRRWIAQVVQRGCQRYLPLGFVVMQWRGRGAILAVVTLLLGCQWQRFDALFIWSMTFAIAYAALHGLQAYRQFRAQFELAFVLLWPQQPWWWYALSALALVPWFLYLPWMYALGWTLLLAVASSLTTARGSTVFWLGGVALSISAYALR